MLSRKDIPKPPPASSGLWLVILGVLLLIVLLICGVLLYRYLRQRRPPPVRLGPPLGPDTLRRIWRRFLGGLPRRARPLLSRFPWVVVFGEAGAGKTQVIESKVDWQGQASQFFPSYISDPLLQIYLGRRQFVQEVAGPLLADTSEVAAAAFRLLWTPLTRTKIPTAMVVVSLRSLDYGTPEQIRSSAQLIRGKLALLAESLREPLRIRVCVTHMDRAIGFPEFARFLHDQHIPFELSLEDIDTDISKLMERLQAFEKYLPAALTALPASTFGSAVRFLNGAPQSLEKLVEFMRELADPGGFVVQPDLDRLYFFEKDATLQVGNPFHVPQSEPVPKLAPSLRRARFGWIYFFWPRGILWTRHGLIASSLLLLSLLLCGTLYSRHSNAVAAAQQAVQSFEVAVQRAQVSLNAPVDSDAVRLAEQEAGRRLDLVARSEARWPLLPRTLLEEKATARARFLDTIRLAYWVALIKRHSATQPPAYEKLLYTLAVVYASPHNGLGDVVRRRVSEWSTLLAVPERVILDYVQFSDPPWSDPIPMNLKVSPSAVAAPTAANSLQPWRDFFAALNIVIADGGISRPDLRELKNAATQLLEALDQVVRNQTTVRLIRMLSEESKLDMPKLFGPALASMVSPPWLYEHRGELDSLLRMILQSSVDLPNAARLNVAQVLATLSGGTTADTAKIADETFRFEVADVKLSLSRKQWADLLSQSRRRILLRSITGQGGQGSAEPEREGSTSSSKRKRSKSKSKKHGKHKHSEKSHDTKSAPAGDEPDEAAGAQTARGYLSSPYTRVIFESEVKPPLLSAEKTINDAQLTAKEKAALAVHMQAEARRYARRYRESLWAYYQSYNIKGDGLANVRFAVSELGQPDSSLAAHLRTVADNANLGELKGPYLEPMGENISMFQPIVKLMTPKDGAYVELDKYRAIMQQLAQALSGAPPAAGTSPEAPAAAGGAATGKAAPAASPAAAALAESLNGPARLALQMLLDQPGSPLLQIQQWADKAGIPPELRKPFELAAQKVLRLGIGELERTLQEQWTQEYNRDLATLLSRFPFQRSATQDAPLADLEVIHPQKGALWRFAQKYAAAFATEGSDGTWTTRPLALSQVKLPKDMLPTLSQLGRLARALWDKDGAPKPLSFAVKPLPLPPPPEDKSEGAVTRTFLSLSGNSVDGFNQMPSERPFPVTWNSQGNAAVGVDLSVPGGNSKRHLSLDESSSAWSFFRLLAKAKISADHVATWSISGESLPNPIDVRFAFASDPWTLFSGAGSGSAGK